MKQKFSMALSLAVVLAMLLTSLALADQVRNNLDGSVDADFELMSLTVGGSNGSALLSYIATNDDGKNGCNLTGSTSKLVVSVTSSDTSVATVSPSSVTFADCTASQTLTVTPVGVGTANITVGFVSVTTNLSGISSSDFNLLPGRFTVNVAPASTNNPPVVVVTGVSEGAAYEIGSVPAAGCSVTDDHDSNPSANPTLGGIVGDLSAYGLGTQTASCSYTDGGGLTTAVSATYSIVDTQAPVIIFVSRTPANENGWNNGDVTLNWSCSDSGSGVVSATVSQTVSTEGVNQSSTGTCTDHAGNTDSDTQSGINIDKTKPVITGSRVPLANANDWNNSDVTVSFACTDSGGSEIDTNNVAGATVSTEGAGQSVTNTGSCTDKAGNIAASATVSNINIDKTAPTASASASPIANANGWNNTDVTVTFSGSDGLSGLASCSVPVVLSSEGAGQFASGTCMDKAGNTANATASGIKIDKTAPSINASRTPAANANGWNNTDVTVSFTGTDGLSGLDSCDPDVVLSAEAAGQSASGYCYDKAGNTSNKAEVTNVNIDKTKPALNIRGALSGSSSVCSSLPTQPTFAPSDALSGLDGTEGDSWVTPGTPSGAGTYKYTAHAADLAGNSVSETRTYTISYNGAFSGYLQPINSDGSSRFKLGSTIPVKFQAMCNGAPISNVVAKLYVVKGDSQPDPGVDEAISTAASTTGNLFRYDSTAQQYIFNLSTKLGYTNPGNSTPVSFSTGTWTLKILLDDGVYYSVNVQLPK